MALPRQEGSITQQQLKTLRHIARVSACPMGIQTPEHSAWRCEMSPAITPRACPSPVSSMKNSTNKYQEEANRERYSETKLLKAFGGIFPGPVRCRYPETQQVLKSYLFCFATITSFVSYFSFPALRTCTCTPECMEMWQENIKHVRAQSEAVRNTGQL